MYLLCASPRRRVLARLPLRPPAESGARRDPTPRLACTAQHEFSPIQERRICLIARERTPTTKKTPWPRGGPRCCAQACLGRAFQSIENRLHFDMCHAVSRPGLFELFIAAQAPRTGRQAKSGSKRSHKEFHFVLAVWRNPSTGTFFASEGELRTSCDI